MVTPSILVVDDEAAVRKTLRMGLEAEGWTVHEAADREEVIALLDHERVDLITLDLTLGEVNGLDLAHELRGRRNIPILMVTARDQPFDRILGLESGADDYVAKPFHIREVVLRIRRTLERYERPVNGGTSLIYDHSAFDIGQGAVIRHDGSTVKLTGIEARLFELFTRHPGRVLTRDEISRALHGRDWSPYDRTIDGHIARLRRKVEPPGEAPSLIRSIRSVGYVFTGEVRPASEPG